VCEHTAGCVYRLFDAAAVVAGLTHAGDRDRVTVVTSLGERTPALDAPFLERIAASSDMIRDGDRVIGVSLGAAGHTMGVLAVAGKSEHRFGTHHESVLSAVAGLASLSLQNARLIEILSSGKDEWERVVDAIRPAIAIVDGRGIVRRANRTFAGLIGAPVTTLPGRPWLELMPMSWAEVVGRALASPGGEPCELRTGQRIFSVRAHPAGAEGTAVLAIEDMTETRRLQEQLIQSEKLSAVGQLIAGVAHELNNPLASVLGFADFLGESGQTPPGLIEPVRVIQHEAQRAAGIVKNLLTFARRQDQERQTIDLGQVLKRTIALLNNQLIGMRIEAKLWIDPELPPVHGSPNQIQQVLLNLMNNAAQAMSAAGIAGVVTVRARKWLGGVAVDVEDNGPGIPEELHERVFEPFFTTKPPGEGTGLGLSICQGIIKEHGGRITMKSTPGQGATFTVELPAARAAAPAAVTTASAGAGHGRVLVVDDEPHILHYMKATLEAWGHSVETAGDGGEGLRRALEGQFDLIITDVRMPRLGGREFFERLRAERPDVASRVVFATGDTVRDDTQAFLEQSGRPFLHKPFKLAELRSTLDQALGSGKTPP